MYFGIICFHVLLADDGKVLAKLPKVKVLRNNQREGGRHLSLLSFNLQLIVFIREMSIPKRYIQGVCEFLFL